MSTRARWLVLWVLLVLHGAAFGTWFPSARFSVFALPALAILLTLDLQGRTARRAVLVAAAAGNLWLGVSLAAGDHAMAVFCRNFAALASARAVSAKLPLWTTGQWSLRWYVEKQGGFVLGEESEQLPLGALLLHPELTDHRPLPKHLKARVAWKETWQGPNPGGVFAPLLPWRAVPPRKSAASFHGGHVWLPYAFSFSPVEMIEVMMIRPPDRRRRVNGVPGHD